MAVRSVVRVAGCVVKKNQVAIGNAYELRIAELERRLAEMEKIYDMAAADLIEALDAASAYRAQATEHALEAEAQRTVAEYRLYVNERRNGVERRSKTPKNPALSRHDATYREGGDRRKSWPR